MSWLQAIFGYVWSINLLKSQTWLIFTRFGDTAPMAGLEDFLGIQLEFQAISWIQETNGVSLNFGYMEPFKTPNHQTTQVCFWGTATIIFAIFGDSMTTIGGSKFEGFNFQRRNDAPINNTLFVLSLKNTWPDLMTLACFFWVVPSWNHAGVG